MHTLALLTTAIFVYYVNNHFMGLFQEYCSLVSYNWKKININCELVTSQHHRFSGSQPDISKCSNANNVLVYSPSCLKFAPKS